MNHFFSRSSAVWWLCLSVILLPAIGRSELIVFEGSSSAVTTGEQFENVSNVWTTNQVVEFLGLEMRARTLDPTHRLNANNGEFGINSDLAGENYEAFDVGETMVLSFDQPVRIDLLDFNRFESGDEFALVVAGLEAEVIGYDELKNKTSDEIEFSPGITVNANTEIQFYAVSGTIGLDSMSVTVIPEPVASGFLILSGVSGLVARRFVS